MISNERPSPYNRQPYRQPYHQPYGLQQPPRPFVQEDTLKTSELQVERKMFVLTLKENARGRFLRITEERGDKRASIIIPSTGLAQFKELLDAMVEAGADTAVEPEVEAASPPSAPVPAPVPATTPVVAEATPEPKAAKPAKKTMSEAAKAKLSAAAKARWAKIKAVDKAD